MKVLTKFFGEVELDANLDFGECRKLTSSELDKIRKGYNNN